MYKFEQLEVYQLSLDYIDKIYTLAEKLPRSESYNPESQITRAATSIALNIAEVLQVKVMLNKAGFYLWLFARCWKQSPANTSSFGVAILSEKIL